MKNIVLAIVITAALIAGVAGYYYFVQKSDAPAVMDPETPTINIEPETSANDDTPAIEAPSSETDPTTVAEATPPTIDEGDRWIQRNGGGKTEFGDRVLEADGVIRKIVTSVDRVSRAENPIKFWAFLKPQGELVVEKQGDVIQISAKNYTRYASAIEALERVETTWLSASYRFLQPLFQDAYAELGNPGSKWDDAAKTTLDSLIAMEIPLNQPELIGQKSGYIFKDQALEELPPIHKLMIRMGPDNAARVQKKLAELRQGLN